MKRHHRQFISRTAPVAHHDAR